MNVDYHALVGRLSTPIDEDCFTLLFGGTLNGYTKFILPEDGLLFEHRYLENKETEVFRLPFKTMVVEFQMSKESRNAETHNGTDGGCRSKRIVLAVEDPAEDSAIIWPISFHEFGERLGGGKQWIPSLYGLKVPYCFSVKTTTNKQKGLALQKSRKRGMKGNVIIDNLTGSSFDMLGEVTERYSEKMFKTDDDFYRHLADFTAIGKFAVIQLCAVLNCSNIEPRTIKPPERINKKRLQRGRLPLFEYKILEVKQNQGSTNTPGLGGTHASPRLHLRRGHIRRLPGTSGKTTWVQSCLVGDSKKGIIKKDYKVNTPARQLSIPAGGMSTTREKNDE